MNITKWKDFAELVALIAVAGSLAAVVTETGTGLSQNICQGFFSNRDRNIFRRNRVTAFYVEHANEACML